MQQFKKLAIAGAVSALMMTGVAEAHVSYNSAGSFNGDSANGAGTWSAGGPSGYVGNLPVNWIANVHNMHTPNVAYEVSTENAGFAIQSHNNKWNPNSSWGSALGFGLIDMHATGNLTIEVKADVDDGSLFTPGFTLFSGWDASAAPVRDENNLVVVAGSTKHQAWNNTGDVTNPNTLGSAELTYVGHSSTTSNNSTSLTFYGLAAGEYSLWIGGNGTGRTDGKRGSILTNQQYIANITASPVPVPAAAWLMGSAVLGLAGMRRKKVTA